MQILIKIKPNQVILCDLTLIRIDFIGSNIFLNAKENFKILHFNIDAVFQGNKIVYSPALQNFLLCLFTN